MLDDSVKVKGVCRIYNTDTGELLREKNNLIVNAGLNLVRDLVSGLAAVPASPSHVAVGSGSTIENAAQTDLVAQISTRVAATITEPADYQIKYAITLAAGSHTGNWYECGIFNAATTGTMLSRVVFGLLTKASGDSFTVEYTISFADDGV